MARPILWTAAVGLLCSIASLATGAEEPHQVADIYPGVDPNVTSDPQGFIRLGNMVLFNAADAEHGRELWRTDGTREGTVLLKDIQPGPPAGVVPTYRSPVALGDAIYFAADDGVHGTELWRTDGTPAGTEMVVDLNPGPAGADPSQFLIVGSALYFDARDAATGVELWRSDGTAAGTGRVADINPGPADSAPGGLTAFRDLIVFSADDGVHGCELWVSDGTPAGTRLVQDTNPLAACYEHPQPGYPPFHDIYLAPRSFTPAGDMFFFTTDRGLWKSDGSEAGTALLHDFYGCSGFEAFRCPPTCMAALDGMLYFQGDDTTAGREPWRSDGTPEGTVMIADLLPMPCHFSSSGDDCSSMACGFSAGGDGVVFGARDSLTDYAQWTTDGTAAGTRKLGPFPPPVDAYPGAHPYPDPGVTLDGALIFGAGELYRHDGGNGGPVLLKDIMQLPASSYPNRFVGVGTSLLFFADDGRHGNELWRSDGDGAALVDDMRPGPDGSSAYRAIPFAGGAALVVNDGVHGWELWTSDGGDAGTHLVKDINPESGDGVAQTPGGLVALGDELFFAANDGVHGSELWRSDGSEVGTQMVNDINPGGGWSFPSELTPVGDTLLFSAIDGSGARLLWRSDGTADGTSRVGTVTEPYGLTPFGRGVAFFSYVADDAVWALWRSDGTAAGTALVRSELGGSEAPSGLLRAGHTLFFAANVREVATQRSELWRSDGTQDGTFPLLQLPIDDTITYVGFSMLAVRDRLFFTVVDIPGGERLWISDGTVAGTRSIKQLNTGIPVSFTHFLVAAGDVTFFTVADDGGGLRLWRSDGTPEGTVPVAAVVPPPVFWDYVEAAIAGGMLYFTADDGRSGAELWSLPLSGLVRECRHDCDQDFAVDVADLVRGVRIALGAIPVSACAPMDADGNGVVAVGELIAAVGEALNGC